MPWDKDASLCPQKVPCFCFCLFFSYRNCFVLGRFPGKNQHRRPEDLCVLENSFVFCLFFCLFCLFRLFKKKCKGGDLKSSVSQTSPLSCWPQDATKSVWKWISTKATHSRDEYLHFTTMTVFTYDVSHLFLKETPGL